MIAIITKNATSETETIEHVTKVAFTSFGQILIDTPTTTVIRPSTLYSFEVIDV